MNTATTAGAARNSSALMAMECVSLTKMPVSNATTGGAAAKLTSVRTPLLGIW
ncbi:hypothetical protein [Cupriavidus necator]|uniref:hypothetical protein n=1 Tax=Cupriavidus necator TaxID=106590 RepID=UPI0030F4B3A0